MLVSVQKTQFGGLTATWTQVFFVSGYSGILPQSKAETKSKLSVGVNVSVDGCLSLSVGPTLK